MINEKTTILDTIKNRLGKMIRHLIQHDNHFKTILEGKLEEIKEQAGVAGIRRSRSWFMGQVRLRYSTEYSSKVLMMMMTGWK